MGLSLLSLLLASSCGSGIEVGVSPAQTLDLEVRSAPLSGVLACLSEKTGIKMILESGLNTRQPVTISLTNKTPAQVVNGLLDGLGLNYAYTSDRTGSKVLLLLISGRAGRGPEGGQALEPPSRRPVSPGDSTEAAPESEIEMRDSFKQAPEGLMPPGRSQEDPGSRALVPPESASPPEAPLYPEALPLSPLSLRDSRRIEVAASPPGFLSWLGILAKLANAR